MREVVLYDLDQPGAAMAIGALPALASGSEDRELTQQWARAIFEDQPAADKVKGIHYRTAYNHGHALALWDCAGAVAVPTDSAGDPRDVPLRDRRVFDQLKKELIPRRIIVTQIADEDCESCSVA
ncbi:RES domain-containing protein [Rhodococcus sp. SMB37]|nr:RES domain-containing protein [Rhodococcus sp. SMB37]